MEETNGNRRKTEDNASKKRNTEEHNRKLGTAEENDIRNLTPHLGEETDKTGGIIYTNGNPCIICTKSSGAEKNIIPIIDEQEAAFFKRPSRTQATNAPHGCGRERHFWSTLQR